MAAAKSTNTSSGSVERTHNDLVQCKEVVDEETAEQMINKVLFAFLFMKTFYIVPVQGLSEES
jgi:hypothetical protein